MDLTQQKRQNQPGAGLLRFNFFFPAGSVPKEASPEMRLALEKFPNLAFFKELSFRIRDNTVLNTHHRVIKDLQKRVRDRQKQEVEERDLIEQTELVILKVCFKLFSVFSFLVFAVVFLFFKSRADFGMQDRKKEMPATLEDVSMLPSIARGYVSPFFPLVVSLSGVNKTNR